MSSLTYWLPTVPNTSDPLEMDRMTHQIVFGATQAGLVTTGRKGEYLGVLAKDWTASEDFKTWTFHFRENLRFETGDPITPADIAHAWEWLARATRAKGSHSEFLERIEGYAQADDSGGMKGLRYSDNTLTLSFTAPFPKLLDRVSLEMFALTDASCRGAKPGEWLCQRRQVSSGPYRIAAWEDKVIRLALRDDFPASLRHPAAPETIVVSARAEDRESADGVFGTSNETPAGIPRKFVGGTRSGIAYVHCKSWNLPDSPCADKQLRRTLRDRFFDRLRATPLPPPASFFPEFLYATLPEEAQSAHPHLETSDRSPGTTLVVRPIPNPKSVYFVCNEALKQAAADVGLKYEENAISSVDSFRETDPALPTYKTDLAFFSTEITVDDPEGSIRYMFLSKEGIRLPDPTGRARSILKSPSVDFKALDAVISDDALIWPISHFGFGLWANDNIDVSVANLNRVIIPLHWLGRAG